MLVTLFLAVSVQGHGRLQIPKTRQHVIKGYDGYENDPVNFGLGAPATTLPAFSCRNDPPKSNGELKPTPTTVTAGQSTDVQWITSADHVGDCALYVSYDYDKEGDDKANMQWFKIANWKDCKSLEEQPNPVILPAWLPAGRAVLRWDWYALHQWQSGNVEYYNQCADVTIIGSDQSLDKSAVPAYSIMGLYPEGAWDGVGWRQELGLPAEEVQTWITGPPCACRYSTDNGCEYTSGTDVTPGFISRPTITALSECGESSTPNPTAPTQQTTQTPQPTQQTTPSAPPTSPISSPTPSPTTGSNTDCVEVWGKCGGKDFAGSTCCTTGNKCVFQSEWYSQCEPDNAPPTSTTTQVPATPIPTIANPITTPTQLPATPQPTQTIATPKPSTEIPATPAPTSSNCANPVAPYAQCGGQGYNGSTCCVAGHHCQGTEWYKNCHPDNNSQTNTPPPTTESTHMVPPTSSPTTGNNSPPPTATPGQFNRNLNVIGYYGNSGGQACVNGACIPSLTSVPEEYNVIVFNFLNFKEDGSLVFDAQGPHSHQDLPNVIQNWKNVADPWGRDRHVLVSIGGQNGLWPNGVTAAQIEANLFEFMEHYGFDGLDVDLEGSALSGASTVAQVLDSLADKGYILAAAPEAAQGPLNAYKDVLPRLTYVHPQFYNNGPNAVAAPFLPNDLVWPYSFPNKWEEPMTGQGNYATQPWWLTVLKEIGDSAQLSHSQLGMLVPATEFAAGNNNIWDYSLLAQDLKKHGINHVGTWAIGHDNTAQYQFAKAMRSVLGEP